MKDLLKKLQMQKRGLKEILNDVDTLCNDDCSPITDEMSEWVKELIREAEQLGRRK